MRFGVRFGVAGGEVMSEIGIDCMSGMAPPANGGTHRHQAALRSTHGRILGQPPARSCPARPARAWRQGCPEEAAMEPPVPGPTIGACGGAIIMASSGGIGSPRRVKDW